MRQICLLHILVITIIMIIILVVYDIWQMWKNSTQKNLENYTDSKWHLKCQKDNETDILFDEWVKNFTTIG